MIMPSNKIYITQDEKNPQKYYLTTPYKADFLEAFKELVPNSDRAWRPQEKRWTFSGDYYVEVVDLLQEYYPALEIMEG